MQPSMPDPDWYFDNVLTYASPGIDRIDAREPADRWLRWWSSRAGPAPHLEPVLRAQGFVLAVTQLYRAGITEQRTRTMLRRRTWFRPARGVVAPLDLSDDDAWMTARRRCAVAASAAVLGRPGHVVSGRSAALLHGLPLFRLPPSPEVTDREQNGLGRRAMSHVHGAAIADRDVGDWFGVPVLTVARTLVDLGRHDRRDAIMAVDAALREGLVGRDDIGTALEQAAGWPGVRQAREVLALGDPRAESPLESLARLVLRDDGFPPPDLQRWIGADRVDMLFEPQRLVLEIDGLDKYRLTTLGEEKKRERRLRRAGFRVERLTWDELTRDWPKTRCWLRPIVGLPVL